MLGSIFEGVFTLEQFLLAFGASIVLGFVLAITYSFRNAYTKSFITSLILIPAIETIVIMLVNDNLGVGLSVAGSFALIRFRSIKGDAKQLSALFLAMTIGVVCGTGYVAIGLIVTVVLCALMLILDFSHFMDMSDKERFLKITIPESLDYDGAFDDILDKYSNSYELINVKTLTLGSLFRIEYRINIKDTKDTKKFIDELRTRNGNLEISLSKVNTNSEEL